MLRPGKAGAERRSKVPPLVVRRRPLAGTQAIVQFGSLTFQAAIGRGGITATKREGDGATPRARMRLTAGYYRGDRIRRPVSRLRLDAIGERMGWCDAPQHASYNRPVRLPFGASHEELTRADHLYDICLVLDWNRQCRRRNAGSAIFLHVARPGYEATEGCIAVSRRALELIAAHVGPGTMVIVD